MNKNNEELKRAFVPKTIGDSLKNINRDFIVATTIARLVDLCDLSR